MRVVHSDPNLIDNLGSLRRKGSNNELLGTRVLKILVHKIWKVRKHRCKFSGFHCSDKGIEAGLLYKEKRSLSPGGPVSCVGVCVHAGQTAASDTTPQQSFSLLFFRQGLISGTQNSSVRLGWLASESQGSSCFCAPSTGITSTHHHTWLVSVCWVLNAGTCSCTASPLPTERTLEASICTF